jgi:hypothetical protein
MPNVAQVQSETNLPRTDPIRFDAIVFILDPNGNFTSKLVASKFLPNKAFQRFARFICVCYPILRSSL